MFRIEATTWLAADVPPVRKPSIQERGESCLPCGPEVVAELRVGAAEIGGEIGQVLLADSLDTPVGRGQYCRRQGQRAVSVQLMNFQMTGVEAGVALGAGDLLDGQAKVDGQLGRENDEVHMVWFVAASQREADRNLALIRFPADFIDG